MSREIKFKAWHKSENKMYGPFHLQRTLGVDSISDCHNESLDERPIWLQFTGLRDKNGVEIYEGDIVRFGDEKIIGDCRYSNGCYYYFYNVDHPFYKEDGRTISSVCPDCEVIGNQFENPELMPNAPQTRG